MQGFAKIVYHIWIKSLCVLIYLHDQWDYSPSLVLMLISYLTMYVKFEGGTKEKNEVKLG